MMPPVQTLALAILVFGVTVASPLVAEADSKSGLPMFGDLARSLPGPF